MLPDPTDEVVEQAYFAETLMMIYSILVTEILS